MFVGIAVVDISLLLVFGEYKHSTNKISPSPKTIGRCPMPVAYNAASFLSIPSIASSLMHLKFLRIALLPVRQCVAPELFLHWICIQRTLH